MVTWLLPSLVLSCAIVDDLRSRKVHNILSVVLAVGSLTVALGIHGHKALVPIAVSSAVAIGLTLPLVLVRALGSGDMKIFAVFAIAYPWAPMSLVWILFYSLFWGALLGVYKALLEGSGRQFLGNLALICLKPGNLTATHRNSAESVSSASYESSTNIAAEAKLTNLVDSNSNKPLQLTNIPFTVAFGFGWLTHLALMWHNIREAI